MPEYNLKEIQRLLTFMTGPEREEFEHLLLARSLDKPSSFVSSFIGATPAEYQAEILDNLFLTHKRVAVRSPHGAGKSTLAAWAVLYAVATWRTDYKIVTTAGAWRQLKNFLWPEIHKWSRKVKWELLGIKPEMGVLSLKTDVGQALAVASNKPELIEGAHATKILYVLDESKAIPDETWDAVEGALSSGEAYVLSISTPGDRFGRFYQIHMKEEGFKHWWTRHVTIEDAITSGQVSEDWVDLMKHQWGVDSPMFKARVLGEFPDAGEGSLIPMSWVEASMDRRKDLEENPFMRNEVIFAGLDVARTGNDDCVLIIRQGPHVIHMEQWSGNDLITTAEKAMATAKFYNAQLVTEDVGVGAGVVDYLRKIEFPVIAVNMGSAPRDSEHFHNLRAELFWGLRELFQNNQIHVMPGENQRVMKELVTLQYKITPAGKVLIESKEDMKRRGLPSPDAADAICLAFAPVSQFFLAFA